MMDYEAIRILTEETNVLGEIEGILGEVSSDNVKIGRKR